MIAVYRIYNTINGKSYVGSSISVQRRKYYHFNLLKRNAHPNKHLQSAYNKYGYSAFTFIILEESSNESVISREQHWLDTLWDTGLYNVSKVAGASFKGRKHDKSTLKKMVDWQKRNGNSMKGKTHTPESINQIRITCANKFKHRRLFTEEQIHEIDAHIASGVGCDRVAKLYGVSKSTIQRIRDRTRYRTVPKL